MWFNVKTYGAIGDGRIGSSGGVVVSGTPDCVDPSNPWTPADVGKLIFGVDQVGASGVVLPLGTIIGYVNAGHVVASTNATDNINTVQFLWATQDDTAAIQAAQTAAIAATTALNGLSTNTVYMPTGVYFVSGRVYRSAGALPHNFVGDSRTSSTLVPLPGITIPGDGSAALIDCTGFGATHEDYGVYGATQSFDGLAANQAMVRWSSATSARVRRVAIAFMGSLTANSRLVSFETANAFVTEELQVQGTSANSVAIGLYMHGCAGTHYDLLTSNQGRGCVAEACHGWNSNVSAPLVFMNPRFDEGTLPPLQLIDAEASIHDGYLYSSPLYSVDLDATSKLFLDNTAVGNWNNAGAGGGVVNMAAGSQVRARGSFFRANAVSNLMINNAVGSRFIDEGGNDYSNWRTDARVNVFWRNAFANPNLVERF